MLVVSLLAVWLILPGSAVKIADTEWDVEKFKEELNKQLRNPAESDIDWKRLECIGCLILGDMTQDLFLRKKEDELISDLTKLCNVLKYLPGIRGIASFCTGILSNFKVSALYTF